MTFRTWQELTVVEQLQSYYSDYHKDVYGFRPRGMPEEHWNSEEWLNAAIADLDKVAPSVWAEEEAREQECIKRTEERIAELIKLGAKDRATAIRWLADANDVNGDMEYLCFCLGVPYGYFKEAA